MAALASLLTPPAETLIYVGGYTGRGGRGIYGFRFDPASGKVTPIGLAAETSNPSFLTVHPNGRFLYAVNEDNAGMVLSFEIDRPTGMLKAINAVSSRGSGPCHLELDRTGRWLFVANYTSGSIAVLPVRDDGSLGAATAAVQHSGSSVNPQRQSGPHAHSVNISPDNRFLLVADLGLDRILVYRFDAFQRRPGPGRTRLRPDGGRLRATPPGLESGRESGVCPDRNAGVGRRDELRR
ncbi:MAG TPA: beta-propeller fold lactonase family protein [Terriglobia bacterium]|nr:beta-propeller fold lactonase family protein [Terriglobia bacterium]